ncbi:MAG: hypothetical protein Q8M94_22340, partial [Ignavibacteria bacterium]|nr:hypothetical protein [Ignavibacteria bacterium]
LYIYDIIIIINKLSFFSNLGGIMKKYKYLQHLGASIFVLGLVVASFTAKPDAPIWLVALVGITGLSTVCAGYRLLKYSDNKLTQLNKPSADNQKTLQIKKLIYR